MVRDQIRWSAEEEAAISDGVMKYGAGKWQRILHDPEFSRILAIRTNVDLKDKWRNMNLRKGGCQKKTSRRNNKSAALTSEGGTDKDETAQPEALAIIHKSSEDGDSDKLMLRWKFTDRKLEGQNNVKQPSSSAQKQETLPPPNLITYSRRNIKTVTAEGKVNKEKLPPPNLKVYSRRNKKAVSADEKVVNKREMECDVTASDSLPAAVDAKPMRTRQMSDQNSAAAAPSLKRAEADIAEAEEAEKEDVRVERC